jgi:hypothetical protein
VSGVGGRSVTHPPNPVGTKDAAYVEAFWRAFNRFFGPQNAPVMRAMLLAKYPAGEAGDSDLDRITFGLRATMAWIAEAIDRSARNEMQQASSEPR